MASFTTEQVAIDPLELDLLMTFSMLFRPTSKDMLPSVPILFVGAKKDRCLLPTLRTPLSTPSSSFLPVSESWAKCTV